MIRRACVTVLPALFKGESVVFFSQGNRSRAPFFHKRTKMIGQMIFD
jgi:hypothetical protein